MNPDREKREIPETESGWTLLLKRSYRYWKEWSIHFYHFLEVSELTGMILLAFLIGIAGGFGAVGFRYLIAGIRWIFYGAFHESEFLGMVVQLPWYQRLLLPAAGGLIIGPLISYFCQEAKGHGVPEVMEGVALEGGTLRARVVPFKTLVSAICIGSGGSAGREGPIVQIGAAAGSLLGQFLNLTADQVKTLLACGAAAGIAGTFNAPIAGAMFSLEIILGDLDLDHFSPILISSVTATGVSQAYLGSEPAFQIPEFVFHSFWEFIPYTILGFLVAGGALLFSKSLYGLEDVFETVPVPDWLKPAIGGLVIGIMGLWLPQVMEVGYPVIDQIFTAELPVALMIGLFFAKIVATDFTLGSGGSGGVFAPSLFMGAMLGGAYGKIIHGYFPAYTADPGSYALVGMGGLVAGATHAPITAMIILFEMTRDYKIILPLMLVCVLSTVITYFVETKNIYTTKLLNRGIDITQGKEANLLQSIKAKEAMTTDVITVDEGATISDLKEIFHQTHHTHFPVIQKQNGEDLVGMLSFHHVWDYWDMEDDLLVARDLAYTPPISIKEDDSLLYAFDLITDIHMELIPVVDDDGILQGVLSRSDIIDTYHEELRRQQIGENHDHEIPTQALERA
ncbi:MAG: chloride channel protein [bacterium]